MDRQVFLQVSLSASAGIGQMPKTLLLSKIKGSRKGRRLLRPKVVMSTTVLAGNRIPSVVSVLVCFVKTEVAILKSIF